MALAAGWLAGRSSLSRPALRPLLAGLLLAVSLLALPIDSRSAEDGSAEEVAAVVAKVQRRYDDTRDFEARFSQDLVLAAGGQTIESKGRVWFRRPGKMRWEYETPDAQTIVADGKHLWVYHPADGQVLRSPLVDAFQAAAPASFLLGVARLDQTFTARRLEAGKSGQVRLELKPREAGEAADLGTLVLEVDAESFDLRAAVVRDPLGNQTRVELHEMSRNRGLDDQRFRFVPPKGADVIEAPGAP